jgi:hypothetical protein
VSEKEDKKYRTGTPFPYQNSRERGPNGRLLCRMCGVEVPKGRRTWCSQECIVEGMIWKGYSSVIRDKVWERDKGICQDCGLSIKLIKQLIGVLRGHLCVDLEGDYVEIDRKYDFEIPRLFTGDEVWGWKKHRFQKEGPFYIVEDLLVPLGIELGGHNHLWEADHIIPVAEGGGACGLDGYRLLCIGCHKAATKKLMRRLAGKPEISIEELQLKLEMPE